MTIGIPQFWVLLALAITAGFSVGLTLGERSERKRLREIINFVTQLENSLLELARNQTALAILLNKKATRVDKEAM